MSSIDDAEDFIALTSESYPVSSQSIFDKLRHLTDKEKAMGKITPGQVTQYSLYGAGFTAATGTIQALPPGCYDIMQSQTCIYAAPMAPFTSLLLELPEMRSDEVLKTVDNFWNSEKDYKEGNEFVVGGAAFKAGIMLYGPPGSGKSCTIKLLCNKLVARGGIVFFGESPSMIMGFLDDFSRIEPNRKSIVILEDIDSLIESYGEARFLEMLDSAKTIDNVLFIATTNYPDRLDARVYNRPGRFSHVIKIGLPTAAAREAYLKAVLKNYRDVEEIVNSTSGFTVDHLSALINAVYREKKDLKTEIIRLRTLFNVPKVDDKTIGLGNS